MTWIFRHVRWPGKPVPATRPDDRPDPEQGATLLETVMSLAMFGALFGLANSFLQHESQRQQAIVLGRELGFMTGIMQDYVSINYDGLRDRLHADGVDGLLAVSMVEIASTGYLPSNMADARNSFDQQYHLLLRGVDRSDRHNPQTTLDNNAMDSDMDGMLDDRLTDNDPVNGEMDLEAILVTTGGTQVGALLGSPAVVSAEMFSAGFIEEGSTARGPYGVWELDVSPFVKMTNAPSQGHFVSIVAASGLNVIDNASDRTGDGEPSTMLDRCPGATAALLASCLRDNEIYTGIVLNSFDADDDGNLDTFGSIMGVYNLEMGSPVDADNDGSADTYSAITRLSELSCNDGMPGSRTAQSLLVNCPDVAFTGSGVFGSDVSVSGDVNVTGAVDADRFRAAVIGNQDLTKGVYNVSILPMDPTPSVTKPSCLDSTSQPRIYAAPVSFISQAGDPILGIRARAVDNSTHWSVHMEASVDRDNDSDGIADVIVLDSTNDHALVLTRCS